MQASGQIWRLTHDRLFLRRTLADKIAHDDKVRRDADAAAERSALVPCADGANVLLHAVLARAGA